MHNRKIWPRQVWNSVGQTPIPATLYQTTNLYFEMAWMSFSLKVLAIFSLPISTLLHAAIHSKHPIDFVSRHNCDLTVQFRLHAHSFMQWTLRFSSLGLWLCKTSSRNSTEQKPQRKSLWSLGFAFFLFQRWWSPYSFLAWDQTGPIRAE